MKTVKIEKKLYKNRFNLEIKQRNDIWSVLCKSMFQKYILKSDTTLDVATGYGEFINNIVCEKKIALDINTDAKRYLNSDVQFLLNSSTKISLPRNSVDKVFISNFFEHITHKEIFQTIKELHRILKPGGRVLILQPNIRFCYKDYWMFFDHITPVDDRGLEEGFSCVGFKTVEKIEKFLPYSTKSSLPKHPMAISLYLHLKPVWKIFGKQSFLVFEK